jgi:hypothetical protein
MKKNLWVLLALSALIAMFVIAGCAPKPTPSPTPTPTASPTVPPADTACPEVVSTDVYKFYGSYSDYSGCAVHCNGWLPSTNDAIYTNCDCIVERDVELVKPLNSPLFKIVITFNENIDPLMSSCLINPTNWYVKVSNAERIVKNLDNDSSNTIQDGVTVLGVEINGKQVIVTAEVHEAGINTVYPAYGGETLSNPYLFCGLICSPTDATQYAKVVNGPFNGWSFGWPTPKIADEVYWKLSSSCVVSDELGNFCCGYDGSDCCVEPICEECVEPCPLGSSTCL